MAEEFDEYTHYVMIGKWAEAHAEQIKALAKAGDADAKTFIDIHRMLVAHADAATWAILAAVYDRLRVVVAREKTVPLPDQHKPAALRRPVPLRSLDVKYVVGVWDSAVNCYEGNTAGPFDSLDAALDTVPYVPREILKRAAIFRQPGDKLLYVWNAENEIWRLYSSAEKL